MSDRKSPLWDAYILDKRLSGNLIDYKTTAGMGGITEEEVMNDDADNPVLPPNIIAFREAFQNVKPLVIESYDDLLLPEKLDELKQAQGRIELKNREHDYNSKIISLIMAKLIRQSATVSATGPKTLKKNADDFAINLAPEFYEIKNNSHFKTYQQVADELTKRKIPTPRSKDGKLQPWQTSTVFNLESRIERLKQEGRIHLE